LNAITPTEPLSGAHEIDLQITGKIGWIAFNRPHVSNAVTPSTMEQLCHAVDSCCENTKVKAIIICGTGDHFAAGADFAFLDELTRTKSDDTQDTLYKWFVGATRRIWRCHKPTIAAVNGAAVTVGCEIALACDIRIVSETAVFHESWLRLGLLPPLGGSVLLPRIVGLGRAGQMILQAKAINAQEAFEIGLASEVVAGAQLRAAAERHALSMAEYSPSAFRLAKESLHRPIEADMEREWQANVMAQSLLIGSEEFRSRVAKLRQPKAQG
jgi:enoyl-CoA hydratase/carnithine racemase